jgi:hypothetical protein
MADGNQTRGEEEVVSAMTMATPASTKVVQVAGNRDIGAATFAEAANYCSDSLDADKVRVRKKLDKLLLPMVRRLCTRRGFYLLTA